MNKLAVIITIALTVFVAGIAVYLIGYNPEWIMQGFALEVLPTMDEVHDNFNEEFGTDFQFPLKSKPE